MELYCNDDDMFDTSEHWNCGFSLKHKTPNATQKRNGELPRLRGSIASVETLGNIERHRSASLGIRTKNLTRDQRVPEK